MLMRPLHHLVEMENYLLHLISENRLEEWEKSGRHYFPLPAPREKPDKINNLMLIMVNAQLHTCVLCNEPLTIDVTLRSDHPARPSFDHVVSRDKGGQDRGNRIAVHRQCNSLKSNRDPTGCELLWLDVVNRAIDDYNQESRSKWVR